MPFSLAPATLPCASINMLKAIVSPPDSITGFEVVSALGAVGES